MQNSDISSAKYIDEDNSDLPRAISFENLSQPEIVQSDPEEQSKGVKTKTQSRFSTAIRKLSGSTRKKKKNKELPNDNILSSGPEDNTLSAGEETKSDKKIKSKLSQRFRIGSLGKSKRTIEDEVAANLNLAAAKSIEISKTREVTSEHEHTIRTPEISPPSSLPGSPRRSDRIQKVQITISGKKIEHTKIDKKQRSITTTTTQITGGSSSKTDYLIPSVSQACATDTAENLEIETKVATDTKTKPTKTTSERLVIITQSKHDKEPTPAAAAAARRSEQTAPPKPSRASDLPDSKTTSSRTSATLKLPTITKKLKGKTASGTNSKSKAETNLMQNTAGTPQRGHRLPKPEKPKTEIPIELQSQSHASQSTTATDATLSGPPSYSPPPIPKPATKSTNTETLSAEAAQATRYTSSLLIEPKTTTLTSVALAPLANISEAVVTVSNSSATDDKVSSAESVLPNPKEYIGREEQPRVQFEVGSAVSPQPKLVSLDIDLDYDLEQQLDSVGSNLSSDSATLLSDSSRKRIRYIAEPSITEEDLQSLANRRAFEAAANLVEENKYSFDSDYDYEASVDNLQMSAFGDLTMDQEMEPTIMTSANAEKREHLYKILVIGELGTGKTSFIKRYVHQFFSQNYRATIGVDFALKVLHWDANTIVRLQLWDIAGQERFGNMTRVYYKEAVGAFIVFDVTRSGTFDCVSKWKEDLDSKVQLPDGSPIPCILLANKCDQDKQGIVTSPEKMEEYCKENGFSGWFETSAKENINIDEAARALVNKILLNDKLINAADLADSERFNLNNTGDQMSTEPKSKCSC